MSLDDFSVVFEKNKRQKLNTLAVIKFPKILNEKQSLIDVAKFLLENSKICEINLVFLPQKMLCVGFYQRIEDRAEIMASALTQGIRIMFS